MAYRKELCTAGVLLLLSLLQSTQSASIAVTKVAESIAVTKMAESIAVTKMEELGKDALKHLVSSAASALRNRTENNNIIAHPYSVGCIREPERHERLNCTLLSTFSSYLETASGFSIDTVLRDKLKNIIEQVDGRKTARCKEKLTNTCEEIFQKNLENVRSVLELYIKWIVKPME